MSSDLRLHQLTYDIPQTTGIDPCPRLRRIAAHVQLSAWVIPEHLVPHSYLAELTERGVTWDLVRFDAAEANKLIGIAARGITKDMEAAMNGAKKSIDRAEAEYHNPDLRQKSNKGVPMAVAEFEERAEGAIKRAQEVVGDLEEAAKIFNIDPARLPVSWAASRASVLRSAAHDRARRFAGAGTTARAVGGDAGEALANAVKADDVPAGVVADYLLENGHEAEGEALIEAFATPKAEVEEGPQWSEEETLSWE